MTNFRLTYSTMFNPPEELHSGFDKAVAALKQNMGREYGMFIGGKDVKSDKTYNDHSPVNTDWILAKMQRGHAEHAQQALDAAHKAFPAWSRTPWQKRVELLRKAASLIEERIFELGAAMALEVGKNRMESLGDVQETADLIYYSCDQMEKNNGYIVEMGRDPLVGYELRNVSVLRPYGVWLVISPFNFPFALTGGPMGAALAAGNTVVVKPATDTAWVARLLIDCFRDAGFPDGVVNFVTGPGSTLGQALIDSPEVAGVTFTGSFDVGMKMFQSYGKRNYVRPLILELGGKNPVIVSKNADLERAAIGIIRSAFGLQGQKCSAASRVLVVDSVYDELVSRLARPRLETGHRRPNGAQHIHGTGDQPSGIQRLSKLLRGDQSRRWKLPHRRKGQNRRHVRQRLFLRTDLCHRPAAQPSPVDSMRCSCPSPRLAK